MDLLFTIGFVQAGLENLVDINGNPVTNVKKFEFNDLDPEVRSNVRSDCNIFASRNRDLLKSFSGCGTKAGRSYWYVRNVVRVNSWFESCPDPHAALLLDASLAAGQFRFLLDTDGSISIITNKKH